MYNKIMNSVITQVFKKSSLLPSKFPLYKIGEQLNNYRIQSEKEWVRFCDEKNTHSGQDYYTSIYKKKSFRELN